MISLLHMFENERLKDIIRQKRNAIKRSDRKGFKNLRAALDRNRSIPDADKSMDKVVQSIKDEARMKLHISNLNRHLSKKNRFKRRQQLDVKNVKRIQNMYDKTMRRKP